MSQPLMKDNVQTALVTRGLKDSACNTNWIHLALGLRCQLNKLGCALESKQPCGKFSATVWEHDQSLRRPDAIFRPGTSDGGTTRTRISNLFYFPLADRTHVTLAHPCTFPPTIARVNATNRLSLSSGLPFRPAFKHLQPSSPSVGLTPAGRLPFSYTRFPTFPTVAHFLLPS
jgi:hypothetical protein